jgi:hypothetical protein
VYHNSGNLAVGSRFTGGSKEISYENFDIHMKKNLIIKLEWSEISSRVPKLLQRLTSDSEG